VVSPCPEGSFVVCISYLSLARRISPYMNTHTWITVTPETALETTYLTDFQRKKLVRQNLFYAQDGAAAFYIYRNDDFAHISWKEEVAFFQREVAGLTQARTAFVSLGCGNARAERMLLRQMHANGAQWAYFGVDTSRAMLELAQETLDGEPYPVTLLLADFTHPDFYAARDRLMAGFDVRIYASLGGTFGNFDQNQIVADLHALIAPGDYFYLDVVPKPGDAAGVAQLETRYTQLAENYHRFFDSVLERLCIPQEHGEVISEIGSDPDLATLRCTFHFRAREQLHFPCFDEMVPLYPGETLELLTIRAYDADALCAFMAQAGFMCVAQYLPDAGALSHQWLRLLFVRE